MKHTSNLFQLSRIVIFLSFLWFFLPHNVWALKIFDKATKPEYFGVYVIDDSKLVELKTTKLGANGNLLSSIIGLQEPPEIQINDNKSYIIFYNDAIPYNRVVLSKLVYKKSAQTNDAFGKNAIETNMWVEEKKINLKVAPISGEHNMYRLVPNNPLEKGVYAIHYGVLGNKSTIEVSRKLNENVYGFLVGEPEGYVKKYLETSIPFYNIKITSNSRNFVKEIFYNRNFDILEQVVYDYSNKKIINKIINTFDLEIGKISKSFSLDKNGTVFSKNIYKYSKNGKKCEDSYYFKGKSGYIANSLYNDNGKIMESLSKGSDNSRTKALYKYNDDGKLTEKVITDLKNDKIIHKEIRMYKKNLMKIEVYVDTKLSYYVEYKYGDKDRLVEMHLYWLDSGWSKISKFQYNKNHIFIDSNVFDKDSKSKSNNDYKLYRSDNVTDIKLKQVIFDFNFD